MKQKSVLIFTFIFINTVAAQRYEGDSCTVNGETQGVCRFMNQCPLAQEQWTTMRIRPVVCGFNGFTPIVCCPRARPNLLNTTRKTTVVGELARKNCAKYSECLLAAFGGVDALFGEFKSMAAIGWPLVDGTGYAWNCGGSLISENYVLTAGHCTSTSDTRLRSDSPTIVKLGSVNLKKSSDFEQDVAIVQIILHPQYRAPNKYNDIALLKLAEKVSFSIAHKPGCLVLTNDFDNRVFNAVGWGKTGTAESSDVLQKVTLNIADNQFCNAGYQNRRSLPNGIISSQVCAGANGTQDTCPGDSGGPLLFKDKCTDFIVGVTSFGIGCGGVRIPGVYTRVSSYIDWIENIVWA